MISWCGNICIKEVKVWTSLLDSSSWMRRVRVIRSNLISLVLPILIASCLFWIRFRSPVALGWRGGLGPEPHRSFHLACAHRQPGSQPPWESTPCFPGSRSEIQPSSTPLAYVLSVRRELVTAEISASARIISSSSWGRSALLRARQLWED